MKTTLDLPDQLVKAVKLLAVHDGLKLKDAMAEVLRKGLEVPASQGPSSIRANKATLTRREEMTRKFVAGEWGVELPGYEPAREEDRTAARRRGRNARA